MIDLNGLPPDWAAFSIDKPAECRGAVMNDDFEAALAHIDRINRAARRQRHRERVAQALAIVTKARAEGLEVRGATIEGVELELGAPESAKAPAEVPRVALFQTRTNPKQKVVL